MPKNGAKSTEDQTILDSFKDSRFEIVGEINGDKVVRVTTQNRTKIPTTSCEEILYIANPKTGFIEHIAFYNSNGIIEHSIDLEFNQDGTSKPYQEYYRRGKLRSEGTHYHERWEVNSNGDIQRNPHDPNNIGPVNNSLWPYVNNAVEYNLNIRRNGK